MRFEDLKRSIKLIVSKHFNISTSLD